MDLDTSTASPSNSSTTTTLSSECLVLQFQEFIPWNNTDNIVSAETDELFRFLKDVFFLPVCFLIGAPSNVINMAVFRKQGLKERINVCLFALSLSDFLYLTFNMLWYGEQLYFHSTTKATYGPVQYWLTNHYLLGFYGFTWVSQVISAIIASERCFCILYPLRSHTVLSTHTTTVIIVIVFVVVTGLYFFVDTRYYIKCWYDPVTDSVKLIASGGDIYHRYKQIIDYLDAFVYGIGLPGAVIIIMTSTTIVTAVKLRQAAQWRAGTSSRGGVDSGGDGGGMSMKELALTKMLVHNSVFFIICVFPHALFRTLLLFMSELNAGRRHHNFFMAFTWVLNILSYINASFNCVIYYTVGSRYRQTVRSLLCSKPCFKMKISKVEGSI